MLGFSRVTLLVDRLFSEFMIWISIAGGCEYHAMEEFQFRQPLVEKQGKKVGNNPKQVYSDPSIPHLGNRFSRITSSNPHFPDKIP